jgi:hypothetical protein
MVADCGSAETRTSSRLNKSAMGTIDSGRCASRALLQLKLRAAAVLKSRGGGKELRDAEKAGSVLEDTILTAPGRASGSQASSWSQLRGPHERCSYKCLLHIAECYLGNTWHSTAALRRCRGSAVRACCLYEAGQAGRCPEGMGGHQASPDFPALVAA